MRSILIAAAAFSLLSTAAFAGATEEPKYGGGTKSQGSPNGQGISSVTGVGDVIGGNGTGAGPFGPGDQTTDPGTRAEALHGTNGGTQYNGGNANGVGKNNGVGNTK